MKDDYTPRQKELLRNLIDAVNKINVEYARVKHFVTLVAADGAQLDIEWNGPPPRIIETALSRLPSYADLSPIKMDEIKPLTLKTRRYEQHKRETDRFWIYREIE